MADSVSAMRPSSRSTSALRACQAFCFFRSSASIRFFSSRLGGAGVAAASVVDGALRLAATAAVCGFADCAFAGAFGAEAVAAGASGCSLCHRNSR